MKTQMSLLILWFWISVAAVHAAQPSGNDVSARVFNSADVTVPNMKPGEWTSLTFNSERWDTADLHDTKTQLRQAESARSRQILHLCQYPWESPIGTGLWGLRLQLNGKTVIAEQTLPDAGASFRISMSVGTLYSLASGDYVEAQVFQNNGNPLLIRSIAATSPEFGMAKLP